MLTRSVYVQRVKKDEKGEALFDKDNMVILESDDIGEVVSKDLIPIPNKEAPGGFSFRMLMTVAWQHSRYPAVTVEDAMDLAHVDDVMEAYFDEHAEEMGYVKLDDEEDEEGSDNAPQPTA